MKPPVFVVGCPRSGTSLLYHLLLSAGGFAEFRTQMNVFDVLEPIYGDLGVPKNKNAAIREWLGSKAFKVSGLDPEEIKSKLVAECANAGDFLRIVMDEIARKQGLDRWIDSTPTNIPHMLRIGRDFPQAQFIHIIRDGRDVALSLDKLGWSRPLPWQRKKGLLAAGLYWKWIVQKGMRYGHELGNRYLEVRYEDLVIAPQKQLVRIGRFLGCHLDYERIQKTSVGSVKNPLTSFKDELLTGHFTPVGRWKEQIPPAQLALFEGLVGDWLVALGYELRNVEPKSSKAMAVKEMQVLYALFYPFKQWAKVNTPLSKWMVNYSAILIDK